MASLKIIVSISDKASNKFTNLAKKLGTVDKRMNKLNREHKKALTDRYNPAPMRRRVKGVQTLHRSLRYTNIMKDRAFKDTYKPSNMLKRINHVRQYRNGISQAQRVARAGIRLPISANMNALNGLEKRMNRLSVFRNPRNFRVPISADTTRLTNQLNNLPRTARMRIRVPVHLDGNNLRHFEKNLSRLRVSNRVRLRAVDEVSPMMQRINGMLARVRRVPAIAIRARDGASSVINRVVSNAGRIRTSYTTRLNAIDRFTGPLSRAGGMIRNFAGRTFTSTIRVVDMATRPLQGIANAAFSTLGLLGVTGGAVGGIMVPLKAVADRQDVTTQFEVMLGGAQEAADRVDELTTFAGSTPFLRDDIFEASRVLQTFTGDALSTGEGLQLIGDVAAGTKRPINEVAMWFGRLYDGLQSGRPVGDATMALQEMGAMSGETRNMIEELAESGQDIADIWPQVTDEFSTYDNMMERMSQNLNNLLLGVRSFITNTLMMPWGEGLESALGPALMAFREWRGDNADVMKGISSDLERYGADFGDIIAKPFYGLGSILDEAFQNEDLNGLGEQLKYAMGRAVEETNSWLQSTGIDKISGFMGSLGETYGGGLNKVINGLMGTGDDDDSIFTTLGELGRESAVAFGEGFIEELDPGDLIRKAFGKIGEINVGGFKDLFGRIIGDEELQSQGNIWGTLLVDAMLLAMASKFIPGFKGLLAGLGTLGGGLMAGLFGKSKGKGGKGFFKGGLIGALFGGVKKIDFKKMFGGLKNIKLPKGLGKLVTGFKGLPLVGTLASAFSIITGDAETMGENIGTILGGLGGAGLGSLFGPVGSIIGGALGAIGGGKIGELWDTGVIQEKWSSFASWFNSNVWEPVKSGSSAAWEWISEASSTASQWISDTWSDFSTWFNDSVWTPISEWASETWSSISNAASEAWTWIQETWGAATDWFSESVWTPISTFATEAWTAISEKATEAWTWIQETWGEVSSWFLDTIWNPIKNFAIDTLNVVVGIFAMAWWTIQAAWSVVSEWFMENVWNPLVEWAGTTWENIKQFFSDAWIFIQEIWGLAVEWFIESVWNPLVEWASNTWNSIVEGANDAWIWIQETWALVTEWFMENVWNPLIEWATQTWTWIVEKANEAWSWIQETWGLVTDWFMENVWNPISEAATTAWNWIVETANNAWTWIQEVWGLASSWFIETVWTPLTTWASETWTQISNWAQDAWTWIQETWGMVSSWFIENIWTPLTTWASETWTQITQFFSDAWTAIQDVWTVVSGWFSDNVWEPIKTVFDDVVTFFSNTFEEAKIAVETAFGGVGTFVEGILDGIGEKLSWVGGLAESVAGAISSVIDTAKNIGSSITGLGGGGGGGGTTGAAVGTRPARNATGGYITKRTLSYIGENGNEFVIPVQNNKGQGRMYLSRAAQMLGMRVIPQGGPTSSGGGGTGNQSSWLNEAGGGSYGNIQSNNSEGSSSYRGMSEDLGNISLPGFESMDQASEDAEATWKKIIDVTSRSSETVRGIFSNLDRQTAEITRGMAGNVNSSFYEMLSNATATSSNTQSNVTASFNNIKGNTLGSAKEMSSGITGFFSDIHDDGMSLFSNLVDGSRELPGRIGSAIAGMASKAVDGASSMGNSIMSKLDQVLNVGIISGLNSVLDALDVAKLDKIDIPTFSTGTSNGRISRDTPGILNDRGPGNGRGGATQELIERRGKLLMPRGKNALVDLKRGDKIYNGAQTQSIFESNPLPHFSEGTVPGENAGSGAGAKSLSGTLSDVVSNVWDYVTSPKKAFDAIVDSVSPDFSGFGGFPGKMLSGAWNTIKDGGLKFLTDVFKENEGGNVDGSHILGKKILQTFGRYTGGINFNRGQHYGIDTNHKFDPVLSPASGKVTRVWNDYGGGNSLELTNARHIWWFMHLSKILKNVGDMVKTGDHIATSGNSGNYVVGSGHLHTQVHNRSTGAGNQNAIDPMPILKGHATGGYVTSRTLSYIGENGSEFVIPVERNRAQGRMYLSRAANMLGMRVTPASENMNRADRNVGKIIDFNQYYDEKYQNDTGGPERVVLPSPKPSPGNGGGTREVNINFTGDIHVRSEEDIDKIAERVKRSIISEIDEEYPDGEVM